ncbi:MAG: hypothetical protein ACMXYD_02430 [Candidatus Woesearchaeota archaeon]
MLKKLDSLLLQAHTQIAKKTKKSARELERHAYMLSATIHAVQYIQNNKPSDAFLAVISTALSIPNRENTKAQTYGPIMSLVLPTGYIVAPLLATTGIIETVNGIITADIHTTQQGINHIQKGLATASFMSGMYFSRVEEEKKNT